jgi:16S rRNA (cytidine1402-2'-O)-methyltransferase
VAEPHRRARVVIVGTLYLVPTPIGNLRDITLRALDVLRSVKLIAAEDTRQARKLLAHYDIHTPTISYHAHNERERVPQLLEVLREHDVALISDAGTPGISDPGAVLIRAAIEAGIPVVALPGPSSILPALVASGLPTDRFHFAGFLPRRSGERAAALRQAAACGATIVCFEAPHRLVEMLEDALQALGDRRAAVARELTKLHEEVMRGRISELREHFQKNPPRGECVVVIAGETPGAGPAPPTPPDTETLRRMLLDELARAASRRDAARAVARQTGVALQELYRILRDLEQGEDREGALEIS